ncbi:hypothetical protein BMR03_16075 [Methylococcaceae bacterium HT2]|nr:hypothetical protein BMR03_16075 [Methylococcaceae bacterium HT2]
MNMIGKDRRFYIALNRASIKLIMRLAISQVLILLLILSTVSNSACAGSGAGGQIRIVNKSLSEITAVWSGAGCAGIYGGVGLSCHSEIIQPGESYLYKYNWGVTTTWIAASKYNSQGCGTVTYDKNLCIYKGWVISTDAYDTDRVTIYSRHTETPPENVQGISQQKLSESEIFWYTHPSVRE